MELYFWVLTASLALAASALCLDDKWKNEHLGPGLWKREQAKNVGEIKFGMNIWASGQATTHLAEILTREVYGFNTKIISDANFASGGLLFGTIDQTLDVVFEIWDMLNPEDIQQALFVDHTIVGYNTLSYESGDGLFTPPYTGSTNYWESQGVEYPNFFPSLKTQRFHDYYTENGTFFIKDWVLNNPNISSITKNTELIPDASGSIGEPNFEFYLPELCETQACIPWVMLDQRYLYNRYQSLIRNFNLPVHLITWDYMDTVFTVVPELMKQQKPFMTMSFYPDTFQIINQLENRIYFPQATPACAAVQNSTTTQGYGSFNCGFKSTKNWKFGSKSFNDNELFQDLHTLYTKLTFSEENMESILLESITNGLSPNEAVCNWLKSNAQVWKQWIYITPEAIPFPTIDMDKIIGISVLSGIIMLSIGYWSYQRCSKKEQINAVRFRVCREMFVIMAKALLDVADWFTDCWNWGYTLIPLMENHCHDIKNVVTVAGIVAVFSTFVVISGMYINFKKMRKMWKRTRRGQEPESIERIKTLSHLSKRLNSMSYRSSTMNFQTISELTDSGVELRLSRTLTSDFGLKRHPEPLDTTVYLMEEIRSQLLIIKATVQEVNMNMVILLIEDFPMMIINVYLLFTCSRLQKEISHHVAIWVSFLSIGIKVSSMTNRGYFMNFLRIIKSLLRISESKAYSWGDSLQEMFTNPFDSFYEGQTDDEDNNIARKRIITDAEDNIARKRIITDAEDNIARKRIITDASIKTTPEAKDASSYAEVENLQPSYVEMNNVRRCHPGLRSRPLSDAAKPSSYVDMENSQPSVISEISLKVCLSPVEKLDYSRCD